MARQGGVLAQLPQELAIRTAECARSCARRDEHAEDLALDDERCSHEGKQPGRREQLRKCVLELTHVGFVHEHAAHAVRQAVRVDRQLGLGLEAHGLCMRHALRADRFDDQLRAVVSAHAAEVDRQIVLEAAQDDLKDALQIEPVSDRTRRTL